MKHPTARPGHYHSRLQEHVVYSGDDSCSFKGWDTRAAAEQMFCNRRGHGAGVCCIQSHPTHEHEVATGSYDENLRMWDLRNPAAPLMTYKVRCPVLVLLLLVLILVLHLLNPGRRVFHPGMSCCASAVLQTSLASIFVAYSAALCLHSTCPKSMEMLLHCQNGTQTGARGVPFSYALSAACLCYSLCYRLWATV